MDIDEIGKDVAVAEVDFDSDWTDEDWEDDYEEDEDDWDDVDESMDGDFDSAMTSAGFGTDEDYGYYGGDEF